MKEEKGGNCEYVCHTLSLMIPLLVLENKHLRATSLNIAISFLKEQEKKITELETKLIELEFTSGIDRVQDSNELPMVKNH